MTRINTPTRRTFLGSIAIGTITSIAGCIGSNGSEDGTDENDVFESVTVEETDLVVELDDAHTLDELSVIRPNGELFADTTLSAGVSRETFALDTDYSPGEYEVLGESDDEEQASISITIEPDVKLVDLRLGRNYPDEMYEGAGDRRTRTETILTLENDGTGPDAAVRLVFAGDVPGPTSDDLEESGIYDTESDLGGYADAVVLPPGETVTIYSYSQPFTSATGNVSCSPKTEYGEFEATVETAVQDESPIGAYEVAYTGDDLVECDIEIEEVQ